MPLDPPDTETSASKVTMCGATKKFKIAPTLEVTMKCGYAQHTALVEHFSEDWIDGVHVQFRWP